MIELKKYFKTSIKGCKLKVQLAFYVLHKNLQPLPFSRFQKDQSKGFHDDDDHNHQKVDDSKKES